jgi:hypothetical protein
MNGKFSRKVLKNCGIRETIRKTIVAHTRGTMELVAGKGFGRIY